MINSTRCPLCPAGVGHKMDEAHAPRVKELLAFVAEIAAESCYEEPGEFPEEGEDGQMLCRSCQARELLHQVEGRE